MTYEFKFAAGDVLSTGHHVVRVESLSVVPGGQRVYCYYVFGQREVQQLTAEHVEEKYQRIGP